MAYKKNATTGKLEVILFVSYCIMAYFKPFLTLFFPIVVSYNIGMEEGKIIPTNTEVQPKKKSQPRFEIKKRKFIKAYLEYGNATKAYLKVYGGKESTAHARGHELLKAIPFEDLLEEGGITDAHIKEKLQEGLQATRPYGKDNVIHPDYATRHSYVTTTLKLKGKLKEQSQQAPLMQGLQIVINK